jgi:hypothetical protein
MPEGDKRNQSDDLDLNYPSFASRGSPVRSRSRPPNICPQIKDLVNLAFAQTGQIREHWNIWEQLIFKLIDGLPLPAGASVRVHFERGRHVRVAELCLRHTQRSSLLVKKCSVRVAAMSLKT